MELTDETREAIDDLILRYLAGRGWTFAANVAEGIELDVIDRLGEWPGPVVPNQVSTVVGRLRALRNRGLVERKGFRGARFVSQWRKARG
jgi:hypothetical protein